MSISTLRDEFRGLLVDFAWGQWGQMGVAAQSDRRDAWAADPEALLLLSFEVGRDEPRLVEEVLDWLAVNERLISVQRLRNLAADDDDRALVEAALGWLGQSRSRPRLATRRKAEGEPQPFFRGSRLRAKEPDPAFLAQGFLKPAAERSGKSQPPDLNLPINFAFRLRLLLGIGVRAEVARALLTVDAGRINAQALAAYTSYTKRNVQEAVASFAAGGLVTSWFIGNEYQYEVSRDRWAEFLGLETLPRHEAWPELFHAWRLTLRWLIDIADEDLSDYMLLSRARTLLEEIGPDLRNSGIPVAIEDSTRDLPALERTIRDIAPR